MNFMPCKVLSQKSVSVITSDGEKTFEIEGSIDSKYIGSEITMGIRPQQIRIRESKEKGCNAVGTVKIIEFQGDNSILIIELSGNPKIEIKAVLGAGGLKFKRGDNCFMEFEPKYIHLFDETEKAIIERKA